MPPIDWHHIFSFDVAPVEIFVRGTVMYFSIFFLMRMLKRQAGSLDTTDLLVLVLIADAAQNGMAGTYMSVLDGVLLVTTLVFWSYLLDFIGYHVPWFERHVLHPAPRTLVLHGRIIGVHMHNELVTKDELMSALREQGVSELAQVKCARLEGDGKISVIKY